MMVRERPVRGGKSTPKHLFHSIGVSVTSHKDDQASPLVVFDPNAGVYRVRRGAEAGFFSEFEAIYGQNGAVQTNFIAQVKLDPKKVEQAMDPSLLEGL